MSDLPAQPIPRTVLIAAGSMVALTLAMTGAVALGILDRPKTADAIRVEQNVAVVQSRDLRFFDRPGGALIIQDAGRGNVAEVIAPGTNNGFIRGVLRGLARDRKMRGIGQQPPFRLTLWANGRLSLRDSATGRTIELDSFGGDNRASFARLLPAAAAPKVAVK